MLIIEMKFKPNKKTCDVTLEDGEIINLTSEAIVKFGISLNAEIARQVLSNAIAESDKSKALEKSINYLTKGYRSERQLKTYLWEKKYSPDIQNYVLEKLKEYNYINDEALANTFVQYSSKKMGINKIKQKLYEKGISKKNIENSLSQVEDQYEICLIQCQKKWNSIINNKPLNLDRQEEFKFNQSAKAKLSRYLFSQGFEWETIKSAMHSVCKLNDEDL